MSASTLGKRKISAIFFDLDDTLVLTSEVDKIAYQEVVKLAKSHFPALDEFQFIQDWRGMFALDPWDPKHQIDVEDWRQGLWLRCLSNQGFTDTLATSTTTAATSLSKSLQACFSSTRLRHFQFLPGVEGMVAALKQQGYTCAVITNGHADVQRTKVIACKAHTVFDHVVIGGEEERKGGKQKPHPQIFATACELVGCAPHEAIMVGDSLKADVQGGLNAGFAATVWINPKGRPLMEGMPEPTHVVEHVLQVPDFLLQLEESGMGS